MNRKYVIQCWDSNCSIPDYLIYGENFDFAHNPKYASIFTRNEAFDIANALMKESEAKDANEEEDFLPMPFDRAKLYYMSQSGKNKL